MIIPKVLFGPTFLSVRKPFIQSIKSTLSYLKSCVRRVRSTPWSTPWRPRKLRNHIVGHGEVRVYRGTGEQLGRDPWKFGSSKSLVLKNFSQSPSRFGIRLRFLHPHFPSPNIESALFVDHWEPGAKKDSQSQKSRTNSAKELSEQFEAVTGHCTVKQGLWGKSHQKVHPNVRQNCGTFPVPKCMTRLKLTKADWTWQKLTETD